ncbi:MAG: transporter substrate-binding domain-containing protein [Oscillospiraceae bacterium]|jgi:polar amino acid transport system substrate-binding protein|nr:transporter substrate-binding domain-containing protein [Oscillospiraceae bacterium]
MRKTVKIVALALALTLVASAFGCSKKVKLKILDTEYAEEDYSICVSKENTQLLADINAALDELIKDGTVGKIIDKYISGTSHDMKFQQNAEGKPTLTMATNAEFPPYEFFQSGQIVGIDPEIAAAIADKLGMKLVIDNMDFGAIIAAVQTGKVDMGMAGMTVTDERLQTINFSTSYAKGVQVIIVREDSDIKTADDLFAGTKMYTIGVQQDTTGDLYTTWDLEDEGLATIDRYNKGADAVMALTSGKVDCVVIDIEPAKSFVASNNK